MLAIMMHDNAYLKDLMNQAQALLVSKQEGKIRIVFLFQLWHLVGAISKGEKKVHRLWKRNQRKGPYV